MEQVELKPCPFCGREPKNERYQDYDTGRREEGWCVSTIGCPDCEIHFTHWTEAQATEAWNTRTNDQAKDEEIARLKGALVGAFETMIYVFETSDDPATADAAKVSADEIEAAILGGSNA